MKRTSPTEPCLATVAQKAGVSPMSVSRVLRNSPDVSDTMRRRVLTAVEELGYRPDPNLSRLMSIVRSKKKQGVRATLGILRDAQQDAALRDPVYRFVSSDLIKKRAIDHGYVAEDFFIGPGGLSPQRLRSVLKARGIEGIIASPQSVNSAIGQFDFSSFSSAIFGFALASPRLHRVTANMMQGIMDTMSELTARGYRRIGLAISNWIDCRSDFTYSGAVLHYNEMRLKASGNRLPPPLVLPTSEVAQSADVFCRWVKEHCPDVIISFDRYVPDWIEQRLGMRIPDDIGYVIHDWATGMSGFAGINHHREWLAAAAVDLVANQLMRNERGIPEAPLHILIPPRFVDGDSIRKYGQATNEVRRTGT